jgi:abortive infection bacteriophage resistance protein
MVDRVNRWNSSEVTLLSSMFDQDSQYERVFVYILLILHILKVQNNINHLVELCKNICMHGDVTAVATQQC